MATRSKQLEQMKLQVGRTAAAARNARGWSQAYVAQALDVDSETISRIERGQSIRLERLLDLAFLYQIPVAAFFRDAPGPKPAAMDEITLAVSILDETNKEWVVQMVKAVASKFDT